MRRSGALATIALALVAGCGAGQAPSAEEVRAAYLRHLKTDAEEARSFGGTEVDHAGILISAEPPDCESDGDGHYHCGVRFAVEGSTGRSTVIRTLHLVQDGAGWTVDSVE
jgi:hypothetical protein